MIVPAERRRVTKSTMAGAEIEVAVGSGDLAGAVNALASRLRAAPGDHDTRMVLFQLLCVGADWDRAQAQLRLLSGRSPELQMLARAYAQAIEAMKTRDGGIADADFTDAPDTPGEVDGQRFDFLFDGDTRFGPTVEAIVGGARRLIPFATILAIDTEGPVDLRDLVWLPARIRLRDGSGLAALLPVAYPGTAEEADTALRLARRTEWREHSGCIHGLGQRIWTTSTGQDVPILEFRHIRFESAA